MTVDTDVSIVHKQQFLFVYIFKKKLLQNFSLIYESAFQVSNVIMLLERVKFQNHFSKFENFKYDLSKQNLVIHSLIG